MFYQYWKPNGLGIFKLLITKYNWGEGVVSVYHAAAKSLQSCPTLCDPIGGSPPGSPVPGILQARTLEWVAIAFSNSWKWKVKVKSFSRVRLFATPWTAAYQAPPSIGFSRQEHWGGVPVPTPVSVIVNLKKGCESRPHPKIHLLSYKTNKQKYAFYVKNSNLTHLYWFGWKATIPVSGKKCDLYTHNVCHLFYKDIQR